MEREKQITQREQEQRLREKTQQNLIEFLKAKLAERRTAKRVSKTQTRKRVVMNKITKATSS